MTSEYVQSDSFCLEALALSTVDVNSFLALAVKICVDHPWAGSPYLLRFCYNFIVPFVYAKDKLVCYRFLLFVSDFLTSSCEKLVHRQSRASRVKRQFGVFRPHHLFSCCSGHTGIMRPQVGRVYLAPPPDCPAILPVATGWRKPRKTCQLIEQDEKVCFAIFCGVPSFRTMDKKKEDAGRQCVLGSSLANFHFPYWVSQKKSNQYDEVREKEVIGKVEVN